MLLAKQIHILHLYRCHYDNCIHRLVLRRAISVNICSYIRILRLRTSVRKPRIRSKASVSRTGRNSIKAKR